MTTRAAAPRSRNDAAWACAFLLPAIVLLIPFQFYPAARTFYLSLTESGPFGGSTFVGWQNYLDILRDPEFWSTLRNTFVFCAVMLLGIPVAIVFAALLNTPGLRGRGFYRVLYFLPVVTLPTAAAMVWRELYSGNQGLINTILGWVGIEGRSWLADSATSLYAIAIVGIWMNLGTSIVIFTAALSSVPKDVHEAATLDGASAWVRLRRITVPFISPSIFFVTVLNVIGGLQVFDLLFVMSDKSNPAYSSTRTVVTYFYEKAFLDDARGYAAGVAFLLLIIIAIITALQFLGQKRWVHYD